jgi:hypothetical protein
MATDTSNLTTVPVTDDMRAQALDRQNEIDAGNGVEDAGTTGDGTDGRRGYIDPDAAPEPGQRKVIQRSPSDDVRLQIAKKFKRDGSVPFDGDMTKPENLYGAVAREHLEPEAGETLVGDRIEPEAPAAPQARMITLKVRGKDVTKSEDEWLADAQKVSAADSYLEEGKALLTEAKRISAERTGTDSHRPESEISTQNDDLDNEDANRSRRPATDTKAIVEKIQFGDPEEAAADLDRLIDARADKRATEGQLERLYNNDLAKSQKVLKDFEAANPEIANNEDAAVLLAKQIHNIYREDIKKLGMDESKIPTNNRDLANWHRWYRVHGSEVTPMTQVFEKAKDHVTKVLKLAPETKPAQQQRAAARVEVNVDRTQRRADIPLQPNRAVSPRRDAVAQPAGRTPAANVIANMRKARGQPTG